MIAIGKEGLAREAQVQGEEAQRLLESVGTVRDENVRAEMLLGSCAHSLRELVALVRLALTELKVIK
jgi:hypothetical protein